MKKQSLDSSDAADERRRGPIRHGSRVVAGRVALTIRSILTAGSPPHASRRFEVDRLAARATPRRRCLATAPAAFTYDRSFAHSAGTHRAVARRVTASRAGRGCRRRGLSPMLDPIELDARARLTRSTRSAFAHRRSRAAPRTRSTPSRTLTNCALDSAAIAHHDRVGAQRYAEHQQSAHRAQAHARR